MADPEFTLPISLLKTMNDIPKDLVPIKDYSNIYRYTIDGDKYILKTYHIGSSDNNDTNNNLEQTLIQLSKFFNEVSIQSSIPHPNILPIVGIILTDQNELRPGIITRECYLTLSEFIHKKMLDPTFKSYFSIAIIDAISELHKRNLVHGDIKPDNIFIEKDEDLTYLPLLADFGSSYLLGDYAIKSGTKFYKAPEIISDDQSFSVGKTSDIFSFGITMLNMEKNEIDMEKIFDYKNDDDSDEKILEAYQKIPSNYNSNEPINDVITKCCDISPEKRPNAEQVYQKIKEGQFFNGTIEMELEYILKSIDERKNKLKNEIDAHHIINKFSTLTEYEDLKETYPNILPQHFIAVLIYLLGIPIFNENEINDPILKSVINDFKSRKNEIAGLQILDLTYNLFNLVKSIDYVYINVLLQQFAKIADYDQHKIGKKQMKMPGISLMPVFQKFILDFKKDQKIDLKVGAIKIENPEIEGKTMKFNVVSDVKIPFKAIKIRKADMTISFVV